MHILARLRRWRAERIVRARRYEGVSRITVTLPNSDIRTLYAMARARKTTTTAALVRAIRLAHWVDEQLAANSTVLLEDPDGTRREIVFT